MIHGEMPSLTHGGFARFSGIELENMGRVGQLARYPIHWHMLLDQGRGQFLKNSSIHHSNNRVVTVHGTDHVLVENNVGYDHVGHGVFLEEGSEQDNVIKDNLILTTRRPTSGMEVIPSDIGPVDLFQNRAPASFWITNPHNTFVGNVAAGSEGTGYWFALPEEWLGFSFSTPAAFAYFTNRQLAQSQPAAPNEQTLGLFEDNSCHSSWLGLDLNDGIFTSTLAVRTNFTWRPYTGQLQTLSRFVAYTCKLGIYTGDGAQHLVFDHAALADNSWGIAMASHDIVQDSVIVRDTGNGMAPSGTFGFPDVAHLAVLLYDGAARLDHVHLVGFQNFALTTALQGQGAARKRTSASMTAITSDAGLLGLFPTLPWIGWQDFAAPVPVNQNYTQTNSELSPFFWAFSIDNPDLSLGRPSSNALPTVVGNHPMMLFGPGAIEFALPNAPLGQSSLTPVAYCSPYRFGFLRVISLELSGPPPQPGTSPYPANDPQFRLTYTRERDTPGGIVSYPSYEDRWLSQFYKQMGIVVDRAGENNGIRYRLAWSGVVTPPLQTEIRLSELQYGDAGVVGLENYLPVQSVRRATALSGETPTSWETLQGVGQGLGTTAGLAALHATAESNYFADTATGILWVRIVAKASAPGAALVLRTDGLGQVIEVNR